MLCLNGCDVTMVDVDGWNGDALECQMCGLVIEPDDTCPDDPEGGDHVWVDNEHGTGYECLTCGETK